MRNVTRQVARAQLILAKSVLDKWIKELEDGVPGVDYSAENVDASDKEAPRNPEDYYEKFCGEMLVVANTCEGLSTVVGADL